MFDSFPFQNNLQKAFDRIPNNSGICPSDRASTIIAISKIRRYWTSCEFLSTAVRRYSIFRGIISTRVRCPQPFTYLPLSGEDYFERALLRLQQRGIFSGTPEEFCTENLACSLQKAESNFMSNLGSLHPKVHAEIQLLMFYESHPDLPSPRVISSSKSACFLCDLFLKRHGRFYTGRTHGVLYPNWAMPNIGSREFSSHQLVQFKNIINGFVLDIEQALRSSIIFQRRRSHPNESVAMFPNSWSEYDSSDEKKESGDIRVLSLPNHSILEFSSTSSHRNSSDQIHPPSVSLRTYHTNSTSHSIPFRLRCGIPLSVRCPAGHSVMVLAPRLSIELSCAGTTRHDNYHDDQKIIVMLCPMSVSGEPNKPMVDLRAMDRGETKLIKLEENSARKFSRSQADIFLSVENTTIQLTFNIY